MLLLPYVYHCLGSFRQVFSRRATWVAFCLVVLGFIGTSDLMGISSLGRFWQMEEAGYHRLLHLFRSSAWSVGPLMAHWGCFVLEQQVGVYVDGRLVLHGDHTYGVKDGTRMPGVVTLHQHSETQSKPSYFRGHHWGIVGMMVGSMREAFCLPLAAQIHQGFAHLRAENLEEGKQETLGLRLVALALDFSVRHGVPSTLVLDAFFSTGPVFALAAGVWSTAIRAPYLHIITRAKKTYVAYLPAPTPRRKGPGKPAKYGRKLKLVDVFTQYQREFRQGQCRIYGKEEIISYKSLNLLWKPLKAPVRFVFAVTSRGSIVLMCSDLSIDPLTAVSLYCSRVRVETLIWVLKGLLSAFEYRFWSKRLPRHSRKPRKNAELKQPRPEHTECVRKAWEASERFVMLSCVALGLLQLLALKFGDGIWSRFHGFLRTRSRSTPSERTVRAVLCSELTQDMHGVACSAMLQQIRPQGQGPTNSIQTGQAALLQTQLTG